MKYVGYVRVSTAEQGKSGLGLDSQKRMIEEFCSRSGDELTDTYVEIESGKVDDRPQLQKAIRHAALIGGRLLVGKLDRISRDLHFILSLQKSSVDFVVVDLPAADRFTISIFGALAERERLMISQRTRAALKEAKARGVKLGKPENRTAEGVRLGGEISGKVRKEKANHFAEQVKPMIEELQGEGLSLRGIAGRLNEGGILTARGNAGTWTATAVINVLARAQHN